jgi:hypothetical protein
MVVRSIILIISLQIVSFCSSKSQKEKLMFESSHIEKIAIRSVDQQYEIQIADRNVIKELFDNYVNLSEKYIVKFKAKNVVVFQYDSVEQTIIFNDQYLKHNGVTYRLNKNSDPFFEQLARK